MTARRAQRAAAELGDPVADHHPAGGVADHVDGGRALVHRALGGLGQRLRVLAQVTAGVARAPDDAGTAPLVLERRGQHLERGRRPAVPGHQQHRAELVLGTGSTGGSSRRSTREDGDHHARARRRERAGSGGGPGTWTGARSGLLPGHAAAPRAGQRAAPLTPAAGPRRADQRPGPAGHPRHPGAAAGAQPGRHHGVRLQPPARRDRADVHPGRRAAPWPAGAPGPPRRPAARHRPGAAGDLAARPRGRAAGHPPGGTRRPAAAGPRRRRGRPGRRAGRRGRAGRRADPGAPHPRADRAGGDPGGRAWGRHRGPEDESDPQPTGGAR